MNKAPQQRRDSATPRIVLYRCPTRTNVLCPCGAVERRLRKMELEHRTERLPYNRRRRPEIEELTGQKRVPVLATGGYAELIAAGLPEIDSVQPNLTLEGLRIIGLLNE